MAKFFFWLTLIILFCIYLGYPLLISILAVFFRESHKIDEDYLPEVTLLVPAYNEADVIADKIANIFNLDYPKGKFNAVILVDQSTDRTEEIVRSLVKDNLSMWVQSPRQGKTAALNYFAAKAKGEIIIFSDANSMYQPDAIGKLVRHFKNQSIGLVCGDLKFITSDTLVSLGESFYWSYEKFLKKKESALHQLLVVNGSIYAIRKKLFSSVAFDLADDFVLPMRISAAGYGLIYEPEAINREKVSTTARDQFQRKVRITAQGIKASFSMLGVIFKSSAVRIMEFFMHKFLRWFAFVPIILMFIANCFLLDLILYRIIFLLQVIFYFFALLGYIFQRNGRYVKIFFVPFYFTLVNFACFRGFLDFLFSKNKAMWEKAGSTR